MTAMTVRCLPRLPLAQQATYHQRSSGLAAGRTVAPGLSSSYDSRGDAGASAVRGPWNRRVGG
jgi:hypothetical protein